MFRTEPSLPEHEWQLRLQTGAEADALLPTAYALAREIAANAPLAVQAIKRSVDTFADRGLTEAMAQTALLSATTFVSQDAPAGYAAKAARRPAEFEGK